MSRIYWREEIKLDSNLLKLKTFQRVAHVEEENGKVLREVWEMQDGRLLRRSVDHDFNELPGSLRAGGDDEQGTLPDEGEDDDRIWRTSTEAEFRVLWSKAKFHDEQT